LVPTSHQLQLEDSIMMQPYGIAKDVLIEFEHSLTLVDFMVMDMDPCQQTSIILGKPFLKSVRATIDKMRGIINMKVDRVHEKFIYHPKGLCRKTKEAEHQIMAEALTHSNPRTACTKVVKLMTAPKSAPFP
jgi:hypothetical protein